MASKWKGHRCGVCQGYSNAKSEFTDREQLMEKQSLGREFVRILVS